MLALLIVAALVIVVAVLAQPLREPSGTDEASTERELEEAKLAKYRELRELELDWRTGKLSEADYQRARAQLRAEAAALLGPRRPSVRRSSGGRGSIREHEARRASRS